MRERGEGRGRGEGRQRRKAQRACSSTRTEGSTWGLSMRGSCMVVRWDYPWKG